MKRKNNVFNKKKKEELKILYIHHDDFTKSKNMENYSITPQYFFGLFTIRALIEIPFAGDMYKAISENVSFLIHDQFIENNSVKILIFGTLGEFLEVLIDDDIIIALEGAGVLDIICKPLEQIDQSLIPATGNFEKWNINYCNQFKEYRNAIDIDGKHAVNILSIDNLLIDDNAPKDIVSYTYRSLTAVVEADESNSPPSIRKQLSRICVGSFLNREYGKSIYVVPLYKLLRTVENVEHTLFVNEVLHLKNVIISVLVNSEEFEKIKRNKEDGILEGIDELLEVKEEIV